METRLNIVVVDDHPLFRQGVVATLGGEPAFNVAAQAESFAQAIALIDQHRPDIVLLDAALPDGSGIDAIEPILQRHPGIRIVMLTVDGHGDTIMQALKAGAAGYLLKGSSATELVAALKARAQGQTYASAAVASALMNQVAHPQDVPGWDLTPRERSVFELLGEGLTNREIAERLFLSEKTVKRHVTVVLQKLGVRNRVEAAILATKGGAPGHRH